MGLSLVVSLLFLHHLDASECLLYFDAFISSIKDNPNNYAYGRNLDYLFSAHILLYWSHVEFIAVVVW